MFAWIVDWNGKTTKKCVNKIYLNITIIHIHDVKDADSDTIQYSSFYATEHISLTKMIMWNCFCEL